MKDKDWITYSCRTARPGELCCKSNYLIQLVQFFYCDCHSVASKIKMGCPFLSHDYSGTDSDDLFYHLRGIT